MVGQGAAPISEDWGPRRGPCGVRVDPGSPRGREVWGRGDSALGLPSYLGLLVETRQIPLQHQLDAAVGVPLQSSPGTAWENDSFRAGSPATLFPVLLPSRPPPTGHGPLLSCPVPGPWGVPHPPTGTRILHLTRGLGRQGVAGSGLAGCLRLQEGLRELLCMGSFQPFQPSGFSFRALRPGPRTQDTRRCWGLPHTHL